jgi:hypothetical protein
MLIRKMLFFITMCSLCSCSDPRDEREKVRDRIFVEYAKKMKSKNLFVAGLGGGCTKDNKTNCIGVTFDYPFVLDIDTSRRLIVESTETLLDLINSDVSNAQFFENFPAQVDIIMISIIGQAPDNGCDYIRSVSVIKGKVSYNTDDPTGKIMPYLNVHEESYEEAKKILSNEIDFLGAKSGR